MSKPTHDRKIKIEELEEITGLGSSAIYRRIARKEFPAGIKFGTSRQSARRWPLSEVLAWVEEQRARSAA